MYADVMKTYVRVRQGGSLRITGLMSVCQDGIQQPITAQRMKIKSMAASRRQ